MGQKRKRRASQAAVKVYPMNWEQKQAFEAKLSEMEAAGALTPSYGMLLRLSLMTGLCPVKDERYTPGTLIFTGGGYALNAQRIWKAKRKRPRPGKHAGSISAMG